MEKQSEQTNGLGTTKAFKGTISLAELRNYAEGLRTFEKLEDDHTPFATLTWQQWQEMQEQLGQCLERFVGATEQKQASRAQMIGLEMLELVSKLLLEAYVQAAQASWQLEALPKA